MYFITVDKWRNALLSAFPTVHELYTELENDGIDGIFMDSYRAVHTLQEINDSKFMVFARFQDEIRYYLAVSDDGSGLLKGLLDENSCFKNHIENSDADHLLANYIQPVKVWNDYILNEFITQLSYAVRIPIF